MTREITLVVLAFSVASGALFSMWKAKPKPAPGPPKLCAEPPASIVICGIKDHPCVTYAVSYHSPTQKFGDGPGEGFTDFQARTIAIAFSKDRFKNVQALTHEVYHAALWERGFKDTEKWDLHAWIYFSEGPFSMVLHDNPSFVRYILDGY
jgi:hypothetical protein